MIQSQFPHGNIVLVADGSDAVRRQVVQTLGADGYEVVTAADGLDALAWLARRTPDVVLCDMRLPRLDGLQTCRLIRRHVRQASLPVIMLSARQGLFDRARCAVAGADAFLGKPLCDDVLRQVVRRHVDGDTGDDADVTGAPH